jgi:hypothetical protein
MASRLKIAEMLDPLIEEIGKRLEGRDENDPLIPVRKHLERLVDHLRADPPLVTKIDTLRELGYLSEHSLSEELAGFHETIRRAIEESMSAGWE